MGVLTFETDGANTEGNGTELITGQEQVAVSSLGARGIAITRIAQPAGAAIANDADWELRRNLSLTGQRWANELLDPTNDGGVKFDKPILIRPEGTIGMAWSNQGAAQDNQVTIFYDPL